MHKVRTTFAVFRSYRAASDLLNDIVRLNLLVSYSVNKDDRRLIFSGAQFFFLTI